MMLRSILFALFASISCAEQATKPSFVPRHHTNKALFVRGGAGPLDPTQVAKAATILGGASSVFNYLAPEKTYRGWGDKLEHSNPVSLWMVERIGCNSMQLALTCGGLFLWGMDTEKAMALGLIPWLVEGLKVVLNDWHKKALGVNDSFKQGHIISLAIMLLACYGGFANPEWSSLALKIGSGWGLLNSVLLGLFPSVGLKAWGFAADRAESEFLVGIHGFLLFQTSGMNLLLLNGSDPKKALGYAMMVTVASILSNTLLSDNAKTFGLDMNVNLLWGAFAAVIAGTLAF
jgi:hypothetical protein